MIQIKESKVLKTTYCRAIGTTIIVKNLFCKIPVRLKDLE